MYEHINDSTLSLIRIHHIKSIFTSHLTYSCKGASRMQVAVARSGHSPTSGTRGGNCHCPTRASHATSFVAASQRILVTCDN